MKRILVFLLCLCFFVVGCESYNAKQEDKEADNFASRFEQVMKQERDNYAIILSIKYDIPKDAVREIIRTVIVDTDDNVGSLIDALFAGEKTSDIPSVLTQVESRIDSISAKYNIPKKAIVSVYIDYKLLTKEYTAEY